MEIVVVGNGIVGSLCALHLRQELPSSVGITVVGPRSRGGAPVVGESTIEITAQFLERLGLAQYLRENHYPKYALTYYFKLNPNDPKDRRYSIQCNEREALGLPDLPGWQGPMARPPSWQLNRSVFDQDMRARIDEHPGIKRRVGIVRQIRLADADSHVVTVQLEDGREEQLHATWVLDASGRRQVLARKLGLVRRPKHKQRDCFWFRVANFDRTALTNLTALGPMPPAVGEAYHYDRYFSTHHFMGKGNWIWLIPLRTPGGGELMSVGLSSRPDVFPYSVRSMEDFFARVAEEHPTVTDLVRTGEVLDTNVLRSYRHEVAQAYSANRWAIVGDAAFSADPLFSNGLTFSAIQIEQVAAMIQADLGGAHSSEYIEALERIFWTPLRGSQNTIADWYESMEDPLLCAARLQYIEVSYFYALLPLITNRCHYEPSRLQEWAPLQATGSRPLELPGRLLALRAALGNALPEHFVYQGKEKVNLDAMTYYQDVREIQRQMRDGARLLRGYTEELASRWQAEAAQ